jgi:prepilin-type N-terminal cleavage/methylation domain-containing protein
MTEEMRAQRGFTLTEMMVVVAILGVLGALALVYLRPQAKTVDVANRVGDLVEDTTRRAISLGSVRADVVTASLAAGNSTTVARARTRISASGTSGQPVTFTIEAFTETAAPATTGTWATVATYKMDSAVAAISYAPGVGSQAALAGVASTAWSSFHAYCDPDGTCTPYSLYFQNLRDRALSANYQARMSILPIGGAVLTRSDWK